VTQAATWLRGVLLRYRVRPEAADEVLRHCDVTILDPDSVSGGGVVNYTARPDYWLVTLYSAQHEAAVHEAAHVWWFLHQTDAWVAYIIDQYFIQGDLRHRPRFRKVRQACWEGVHGGPTGKGVYWADYAGRYDDRECFAGLASLIMGDVLMLPPGLRELYERMFRPAERIYMPMVWG